MKPAAAAALLAALAAAALLAHRTGSVAAIAVLLLVVCLRAPAGRRRLYLVGAIGSGLAVVLVTPFVETIGSHPLWTGPTVPVLRSEEHTSELQSRRDLVCRLLLEKKKQSNLFLHTITKYASIYL